MFAPIGRDDARPSQQRCRQKSGFSLGGGGRGGWGSIRRHTRLHFSPGRSLRKRRGRRRGSGKGAEEEEVEDLGRLCKTRPDKDCPINTQVPARTTAFSLSCCCSQLFPGQNISLWTNLTFLLVPELVSIVRRQTAHWIRISPPLVTSWSGPDA